MLFVVVGKNKQSIPKHTKINVFVVVHVDDDFGSNRDPPQRSPGCGHRGLLQRGRHQIVP
jgi:hypothetical protein